MSPGKIAVIAAVTAVLVAVYEKTSNSPYYYEEEEVKRWVLGPGGREGNCDLCVDNADMGWIGMDDVFDGVDGDIDEAPAHPNCECEVEYKTKRTRVYV